MTPVKDRLDAARRRLSRDGRSERKIERPFPGGPYVLAAHARRTCCIQSLAMRCGYPASSIRERIYADWQGQRFGLLLYTASSDAEGTLGGLVLAGPPHRARTSRSRCGPAACARTIRSARSTRRSTRWRAAGCMAPPATAAHSSRRRRARCATTCSTGHSSSQRSPCRTPRSSRLRVGVIESLVALPAHVRDRLARALEAGALRAPYSEVAVQAALGGGLARSDLAAVAAELRALADRDIGGGAVALALRAAASAAAAITRPDLVWSGPPVAGLHARDTRQVYDELVGSATRSLWISTYAYFDGPRAFETLAEPHGRRRRAERRPPAQHPSTTA